MSKKSRLNLSKEDMHLILKGLANAQDSETLQVKEIIEQKYFADDLEPALFAPIDLENFTAERLGADAVIKAIVNALHILSGVPINQIKQGTKITAFNLSTTQLTRLRVYLNDLIRNNGSTRRISEQEFAKAATVQDIIVLVLKKIAGNA